MLILWFFKFFYFIATIQDTFIKFSNIKFIINVNCFIFKSSFSLHYNLKFHVCNCNCYLFSTLYIFFHYWEFRYSFIIYKQILSKNIFIRVFKIYSFYYVFKLLIWMVIQVERLLDLVYQDVEKILQLPEVNSFAAEYVKLDNAIDF